MQRVIYCPGPNRWVSIRAYVKAVKTAKAHPDAQFKEGITCWWPCTGREVMQQFRRGLRDRINQAVPYYQRGVTQ